MKMNYRIMVLLTLYFSTITTSFVFANPIVETIPFSQPATQSYSFKSDVLGLTMRISVTVPLQYVSQNTNVKYPTMYVIDGYTTGTFVAASNIIQSLGGTASNPAPMPEVITVTIDFLAEFSDISRLRFAYYTPSADTSIQYGATGGKADQFIEFLQTELKPFIQTNYNVDEHNQTFAGHSLGGLFTLYMLLTQAQTFDNYIAASPSVWWDNAIIYTFENNYFNQYDQMNKNLYISVGLDEDNSGIFFSEVKTMATTIKSRNYRNLNFKIQAFENEIHNSVVINAYTKGARFVFNTNSK